MFSDQMFILSNYLDQALRVALFSKFASKCKFELEIHTYTITIGISAAAKKLFSFFSYWLIKCSFHRIILIRRWGWPYSRNSPQSVKSFKCPCWFKRISSRLCLDVFSAVEFSISNLRWIITEKISTKWGNLEFWNEMREIPIKQKLYK